jgi:hypothetical protein
MAPGILEVDALDNQTAAISTNSINPLSPVLDARLITQEFDPLRFDAGASLQLLHNNPKNDLPTNYKLISSPYNDSNHLLDLLTLSLQEALLAKALTVLKPIRPDYATAEYTTSLNWDFVLSTLRSLSKEQNHEWKEQSFYTVIFRSKLLPTADVDLLYALDQNSHAEASVSGGLLKYWFGKMNDEHRNLATCTCLHPNFDVLVADYYTGLWRSREDARLGGLGPWHKKSRLAAREMYESITFEVRKFVVLDGAQGFKIEQWDS